MFKKTKKLTLFLLIASLVLSLCACGVGELPGVQPSAPAVSVSGALPGASGTPAPSPDAQPGASQTPAPTPESTPAPESTPTPDPAPAVSDEKVSSFSIHFIDVGQADAALVQCDGRYMLIDGGNKADSNLIYSVLSRSGVTHLDMVVGTHAHEDHIGGLPGAFSYATAGLTLCPVTSYDSSVFNAFASYARQKGGGITVPRVGDSYMLGSARVDILGVNSTDETNNTSIVLKITYGKTSFLFTGDAELDAEQVMLDSGADLSATVLKVGHHGSDTSTGYQFLREVMPQYAVISVGKGNSYGHPTELVLSRLRDAQVKTYRTDLQGDIYCTSDGQSVTFSVKRNPNENTLSPAVPDVTAQPVQSAAPQSTPAPTPEPTPVPTQQAEQMVWIPQSGTKYHSSAGCSGMKDPSQVTVSTAVSRGFTPCKKCW